MDFRKQTLALGSILTDLPRVLEMASPEDIETFSRIFHSYANFGGSDRYDNPDDYL
jgi:hypothetical protein